MQLTADNLQSAVGCARGLAIVWAPLITEACSRYGIDRPARLPRFLAQTGHESAGLSRTVENLNYRAEALTRTWPARFPPDVAPQYAHQSDRIANRAYANRMGNGDEASGDGSRYKGRGLLQVTGKVNYEAVSDLLHRHGAPNFVAEPGALAEPRWAALSAAALWNEWDLNALADAGDDLAISRRINLGSAHARGIPNGWEDRKARTQRAIKALAA